VGFEDSLLDPLLAVYDRIISHLFAIQDATTIPQTIGNRMETRPKKKQRRKRRETTAVVSGQPFLTG
jgi:hypothetical protein